MRRIPLSVTPYGPGKSRHVQDTFLINDHRSDLVTILDAPALPSNETSSLLDRFNVENYPFVLWYFACPRFDHRYPIYLVNCRYGQTCLLVPVILQPHDLVTCLQTL